MNATAATTRFIESVRLEFLAADFDDSGIGDDELWEAMALVAKRAGSGDYPGSPGIPMVPTGITPGGFVAAVLADDPIVHGTALSASVVA